MAEEKAELIVYNNLTKQKEVFKPKVAGKVGMYVCGVTAYDYSHIGHARAYVAFDILYRYLRHLGYEVTYVRNFTDVDDKIIKRANERGVDPISLSAEFCEEFLKDMADLQCLLPTHQPRVSDHMEKIKDMISQIENNGCAYRVEGDVYFSVDNSPKYGQLSGRKLEDNRSGERVAVDSRKRNHADFALWKSAKDGEPSWESPWGPGRPGWHIECSAMSAEYLTPIFDIHGGGMDLIFPHHENEIAQSCAACPESNVSYWMHNGFVTTNDEKMSKSLGNFFTIRKVTELYHPLALRHFLLGTHYRSPVNYSIAQIEIASEAVYRIYQTLQDCQDALSLYQEGSADTVAEPTGKKVRITDAANECIRNLQSDVRKMSDDLHTYSLLNSALPEALKLINSSLTMLKKKQQQKQKQSVIQSLKELEKEVRDALDILGLLSSLEYSEVLGQLKSKALTRSGFEDGYIEDQIKERALARKNKEFSRGDEIRSELAARGIAHDNDVIVTPNDTHDNDDEQINRNDIQSAQDESDDHHYHDSLTDLQQDESDDHHYHDSLTDLQLAQKALEDANDAKLQGNYLFRSGQYDDALMKYDLALQLVAEVPSSEELRSACYLNRATCFLKMGKYEDSIKECTKALELNPSYKKALLRRAEAHEKLEHFEEAVSDLKKLLEMEPYNTEVKRSAVRLEQLAREKQEKMKEEMIGKLKDVGNSILGKFGMSVDNFKAVQDPKTGSYSLSYQP